MNSINQNILSNVSNIGLSDKEALVYTVLATLGGAFPSRIAEEAKLNRSTTYKILLDLSIKGLVNEIKKKNKLYYQIERPQKLIRYAKDRVEMAKDQLDKAEKALPELEGIFSFVSNKPKVLFFEGPDTIQNVCNDMVSEGKYEMLAFSNAAKFQKSLSPKKLKEFVSQKARLGITTRAVVPDTVEGRKYSETVFGSLKKSSWPIMRFVPADVFFFDAELTLYGKNKISITKLSKDNPIGVIIEDDVIYQMMKMIFELAWRSAGV